MKRYALPLLSVTGGAGCFILRLLQNRTAFEPDTGLPIPGHPLSILLPAVLVLLAAAVLLLARRHRDAVSPDLREGFCGAPAALILAAAGIVLWLCSAAAVVLPGQPEVTPTPIPGLYLPADPSAERTAMVTAILLAVAALALLPAAAACRKGGKRSAAAPNGNLLLIPPVALVIRLALEFREMSVDASQQRYYVELLALVLLVPTLFSLSSFAFRCGKTPRFLFFAAMTAVFCLAALADADTTAGLLFYAGGAALALGFLLLRLSAPEPAPQEIEDIS